MPGPEKVRKYRCSYRYERRLNEQGFHFVAGVDEVGRGALCGPVVAAAVIFKRRPKLWGVRDSKQLTAVQREKLLPRILRCAVSFGIGIISAEEIDRINIYQASLKAMRAAVQQLHPVPDFIVLDGMPVKGLSIPHLSVVKGDAKCFSIAAASIIAKVTRDHLMLSYDAMYPQYGWARNKGYSAKSHFAALREHGKTAFHRNSFHPCFEEKQLGLLGAG